jgi:hypothetical protein
LLFWPFGSALLLYALALLKSTLLLLSSRSGSVDRLVVGFFPTHFFGL